MRSGSAVYHFNGPRSGSSRRSTDACLVHGCVHEASAHRNSGAGLPLNNPLRIAEEVVTIDELSEGRFEFGIGWSGSARS